MVNVINLGTTSSCSNYPQYCQEGYSLYFPCLKDQYIIDSYEFENNINVETTDDFLTVSVDLGDPENDPVLTYSYTDNEIFIASGNDDLRRIFNFLKKDFDCERVREEHWLNKIIFNDRPTNALFLRIMYQFTTWFDYLYTEKD